MVWVVGVVAAVGGGVVADLRRGARQGEVDVCVVCMGGEVQPGRGGCPGPGRDKAAMAASVRVAGQLQLAQAQAHAPTTSPPSTRVAEEQAESSRPSHTSTGAQRPPAGQQLGKVWPVHVSAMVWKMCLKDCKQGGREGGPQGMHA